MAVAGALLAVGIAAAGTFAVMNGDGAGESSSSPSSARKGPPSCSANRCTLALADLDVLAHDVAISVAPLQLLGRLSSSSPLGRNLKVLPERIWYT